MEEIIHRENLKNTVKDAGGFQRSKGILGGRCFFVHLSDREEVRSVISKVKESPNTVFIVSDNFLEIENEKKFVFPVSKFKGLERKKVILVGFFSWLNGLKEKGMTPLEELNVYRILYTAVTRAREEIIAVDFVDLPDFVRDKFRQEGQRILFEEVERLPEEWLEDAEYYQKIGETEFAREAFLLAAELFKKQGEIAKTIEMYKRANAIDELKKFCEGEGLWNELADALYEIGEFNNAGDVYKNKLRCFDRAIECYEKAGEWEKIAAVCEENKNYRKAVENYEKAGKWEKAADILVRYLSDYRRGAKDYEKAHEFEKAGKVYERLKDWGSAIRVYEKANRWDKIGDIRLNYLGEISQAVKDYKKAGRWDKVAQAYEKMCKWNLAGEVYEHIHDWRKAVLSYEKAELWFKAGQLSFERLNDYARAGTNYEKAKLWGKAVLSYEKAGLWSNAGKICLEKLKDYRRAGENYERAESWGKAILSYEKAGVWLKAAELSLEKLKDYRRAGINYEKAELWDKAGECYEKSKDWDRAGVMYEYAENWCKAGDIYYNKLENYAKAGEMYEKAGRWSESALCYERAKKWRKSADIYFNRLNNYKRAAQLYELSGEWNRSGEAYERISDWCAAMLSYERAKNWQKVAQILQKLLPSDEDKFIAEFRSLNLDLKSSLVQRELGVLVKVSQILLDQGKYREIWMLGQTFEGGELIEKLYKKIAGNVFERLFLKFNKTEIEFLKMYYQAIMNAYLPDPGIIYKLMPIKMHKDSSKYEELSHKYRKFFWKLFTRRYE